MDCLRSFTLTTSATYNYTAASNKLTVWGAPLNFSIVDDRTSIFLIQGFKNINIYGVDMIGNVSSAYQAAPRTLNANVKDFECNVILIGDIPVPIGKISATNDLPVILNDTLVQQTVLLTKYKTNISFATPIQSVQQINLTNFKFFGDHVQNAGQVNMGYFLEFVFYYKYEGE
jgi:hypothetical protein